MSYRNNKFDSDELYLILVDFLNILWNLGYFYVMLHFTTK